MDISFVREIYHVGLESEDRPVLTERDFHQWIIPAVNSLGLVYVNFGALDRGVRSRTPVANSEGLSTLYDIIKEEFNRPDLLACNITSCYGFIDGNLMFFEIETLQ